MILPRFEYLAPKSIEEACSLLGEFGEEAKVLAGGTDLLVKMKQGLASARYLISLKNLAELNFISLDRQDGLGLGAMTSLNSLIDSSEVRQSCPGLAEAALTMASVQIRNIATLGGNLCNASPAADTAPVLLAYGARAKITGRQGPRWLALDDFFLGPGITALKPGEILTDIQVPAWPLKGGASFQRFGLRKASALAVVSAAAAIALEDNTCTWARIALGAVAPTPLRAHQAEQLLTGQRLNEDLIDEAAKMAGQEARPISDLRGSAEYRLELTRVLTRRALAAALARAKREG